MTGPEGADRTQDRTVRALASAASVLVEPHDAVGTVIDLLFAAARATGATGGGVTLRDGDGRLALLAATSHRAEELELHQAQFALGPCYDAVFIGSPVTALDPAEIQARWPTLEPVFAAAGYTGVRTSPLRWHGAVMGAINLFWTGPVEPTIVQDGLIRTFADLATLAIMHTGWASSGQWEARTRAALDERTLIEQAKGVMAHRDGLQMDAAFDELLDLAARSGRLLSQTAADVVRRGAED